MRVMCVWGVFRVALGFAAAFCFNHIPQLGQRPRVLGRSVMGSSTELQSLCRKILA